MYWGSIDVGEKYTESSHITKVEPEGLSDGLEVGSKGKRRIKASQ